MWHANDANDEDDEDEDDVAGFYTGGGEGNAKNQQENMLGAKSTAGFMRMLESDMDFDVEIGDDGEIIEKKPTDPRKRFDSSLVAGADNEDARSVDDNGGDGNVSDDNQSASGSEVDFGGAGGISDGVPLEQFKAVQSRLVTVVGKFKGIKKEAKEAKKKLKVVEAQLAFVKEEVEDNKTEIESMEAKLAEAYSKTASGGSSSGGGGGAGGAALEEQRRKQREEARKALFSGADEEEEEAFHLKADDLGFLKEIFVRISKKINKLMPLAGDIRNVQGHFGSSVASFFSFYRWIIITNVYAGVLCLIFLVLHLYSLLITRTGEAAFEHTFTMYVFLPGFMAISSYNTDDRYQYLALVVLLTGILFFDAIRKWISEDANSKIINSIESEQANIKFAKQFLCCWDFGLNKESDVEDLMCTIGSNMMTMLAVDREQVKEPRNRKQLTVMYARRGTGILIYTTALVGSWATIILLTAQQNVLAEKLTDLPGAEYFSSSIVPGCVTAINSIMPMLIDKITAFEKWDTEKTVTKVLLLKMYLAKILNVLIQFFSYLLLADPVMFTSSSNEFFGFDTGVDTLQRRTIRSNVEASWADDGMFVCRLDQVAASLVQLLTVDFVVSKVIAITMPYVNLTVAKVRKKPFKREEFTVAKKMVNLLYFQGLVFLSMPFAPLFTFVVLIFQFLTFKFEKFMLFKFGTKPKKEWKAQDAGGFFIKFYLITIIVTGMLAAFLFLTGKTFAKDKAVLDDVLVHCSDLTDAGLELTGTCTTLTEEELTSLSSFKCGPFTQVESAWAMVEQDVVDEKFSMLSEIAYTIMTQAGIIWFIVLFFYLKLSFTESTLGVSETSIAEKERAFEAANQAADTKIRRLMKRVKNLEAAAKA
jgi:hypothetical protein